MLCGVSYLICGQRETKQPPQHSPASPRPPPGQARKWVGCGWGKGEWDSEGGIWRGEACPVEGWAATAPHPPLAFGGNFRFCKGLLFSVIIPFLWSRQGTCMGALPPLGEKLSLRDDGHTVAKWCRKDPRHRVRGCGCRCLSRGKTHGSSVGSNTEWTAGGKGVGRD